MSRSRKKKTKAPTQTQKKRNQVTKPKTTGPITGTQNVRGSARVRVSEHAVHPNLVSLQRVCNALVQFAVKVSAFQPDAATGNILATPKELYYGLYDDLLRAMRPVVSEYLNTKNVPLFYREIFEALTPGVLIVPTQASHGYKWVMVPEEEPDMAHVTYDSTLLNLDDWGGIDTNGFNTLDPATPVPTHAQSKDAVEHFFNICVSAGCPRWLGGPTVYNNDTSVFAFGEPSSFSSVQADLTTTNQAQMMHHEGKVAFDWVACLQMVKSDVVLIADRFPRHNFIVSSGPGAIIGHRLNMGYTGYEGIKDRLHFSRVDMTKFEAMMVSLINGSILAQGASSEQSFGTTPFNGQYDFNAFRAYLHTIFCTHFLDVSPVIHDVNLVSGIPIKWGQRFLPRTKREVAREKLPQLMMENIRMLKACALEGENEYGQKVVDYYYPVPSWALPGDEINLPLGVGHTIDDVITGTDVENGVSVDGDELNYNLIEAVGENFKDFVDLSQTNLSIMKEYMPMLDSNPWAETQAGSQLMLLANLNPVIVVVAAGTATCETVVTGLNGGHMSTWNDALLKKLRNTLDRRDASLKAESVFVKMLGDKIVGPTQKNVRGSAAKTANKKVFVANVSVGIAQMLPGSGKYDIFKQLVLPDINIGLTGSGNFTSSVMSQYKIRDVSRGPSTALVPILDMFNDVYRNVRSRGATSSADTELMKVFRQKSHMGLGANVASSPPGTMLEHYFPTMGPLMSAAIGTTRLGGLVDGLGGMVISWMDQEKLARREQNRKERMGKWAMGMAERIRERRRGG